MGTTNLDSLSLGGTLTVTGATTQTGAQAFAGAVTMASTLAVTGAVTLTVPLTKANINGSAKRERFNFSVNAGGTIADGTTYTGYFAPGRAGTVTKVSLIASTAPVGGTNTVNVKKGGASGQSVLSAAFDPTTLVADTISAATLNATAANLAFTAAEGLYVEWVAGTQSTDGVRAAVCIEVEFDDL